ncbi:MAG TPA: nitroreductase family deazaflavin-dependent oxidoreductase [Ilumatobacteraceae bacterium]
MSDGGIDELGINARGPQSRDHARRYIESGGADGALDPDGRACLLLVTRGRRSGAPRRNVLLYAADGDAYVVAGSRGGDDQHPHWYLNLVADQHVEVWVGTDRFSAVAQTVTGVERDRLWPLMTAIMPQYDDFQAKTTRVIPVVVLERRPGTSTDRATEP